MDHSEADLTATVRQAGGTLIITAFLSREAWERELKKYRRGCGAGLYVIGTNGGLVRCGSVVTGLDGATELQLCYHCRPQAAATREAIAAKKAEIARLQAEVEALERY